ncbi:MAG TPA: PAS domain S-box protein [Terriglobales bacterium]|nr:PAS domain S-box protein [Terriglobales bacterium]
MLAEPQYRQALRYGITLPGTAVAVLLTSFIPGAREEPFFPFFTASIVISAWFGGWLGGVLGMFLSTLATAYFIMEPAGSLGIERQDAIRLLAFDSAALLLIGFVAAFRSTRAALGGAEERYRLLFERSPQPMWVYDQETLRFLAVNDAAVDRYGYSQGEFLNMTIADIRPSEDAPRVIESAREAERQESLSASEWRHCKKDGTVCDVLISSHAFEWKGKAARLVLATDITERRRAERALAESEANYRSLVENAPYAIYVSSIEDDRFLSVNPALVNMLGYRSKEEVLGLRLSTDVYCDPADRHEIIERARSFDHFTGSEVNLKRQDGTAITVRVGGRTLHDSSGEVAGFEGILEDITERRKLEEQFQQAQKMEAVGTFAGGLAHDFNNILMITQSYAAMLLERLAQGDRLHKHAESILKAAQRGAQLTRQLLAFSRRQVLAPRVLSVNELLTEIGEILPRLIGEDIKVKMILQPGIGRVRVDSSQFEQVIMNLATNARDAMPRGGTLTIETSETELDQAYIRNHVGSRPGRHVMVAVSDTGMGMDAETRARIFEPFFTTKEIGRGTGLGLSSVYGIVKQSGGSIWVYSEPGKGTTFKIYLPRIQAGIEEEAVEAAPAATPVEGTTVLLVEDEDAVRAAAADYLQLRGFHVLTASNGSEALQLARQHQGPIQALVTDIVMPGITGPELAHQIAELFPQVRIIFTSGYTGDTVLSQGMLRPGSTLLQKPFPLEDLVRALQGISAGDGASS